MSDALPYTDGTRIPRLLAVRNYLKNYVAIHKHMTRFRIGVQLGSPVYLGLEII